MDEQTNRITIGGFYTPDVGDATEQTRPATRADLLCNELLERIERVEGALLTEIHMLKAKSDQYETRLRVLEDRDANQPENIAQLHEDMKWLYQRCDDIQRIFNFDTMIINGIQKQGE